jgi:hypothetical protein
VSSGDAVGRSAALQTVRADRRCVSLIFDVIYVLLLALWQPPALPFSHLSQVPAISLPHMHAHALVHSTCTVFLHSARQVRSWSDCARQGQVSTGRKSSATPPHERDARCARPPSHACVKRLPLSFTHATQTSEWNTQWRTRSTHARATHHVLNTNARIHQW